VPSVHAGLSGDGTCGLIRWADRFVPDAPDEPGQTTCQNGEHLPFVGLVAAVLAGVIRDYVTTGERRDAAVTDRA
jgi:molybdopterin-synthase adenylyltransferase